MSSYDAIVIGSGFGGGAAACRMAEAGMRVAILERGRRWERTDFPEGPDDAAQLAWHPHTNPRGLYDLRLFEDGVVLTAAGVGGGSLLYYNVQLEAREEVFSDGWPAGIDLAALQPWYRRCEEALDPKLTPSPAPSKVRAFRNAAKRFGHEAERVPLAVHFGEPRAHPLSGHPQDGCENLGRCGIGCPLHAKNTTDITYVARAEQLGADLLPLHEALRLEPPARKGARWTVGYRDLQYDEVGELRAPVVVVAAGTLGSARLLLQSRERGDLPKLSPALGTRFSGNGNALGVIFEPEADSARGARVEVGPSITSRIDLWEERGFIIEDLGLPPRYMGVLDGLGSVSRAAAVLRPRLIAKEVALRFGDSDRPASPTELAAPPLAPHGRADVLTFLFMGKEAPTGTLKLSRRGQIDIDFGSSDSRLLYDRMSETLDELAGAIGGRAEFNLRHRLLGKYVIAHPLGGCPMADDPQAGVVDGFGRVHGYPGLHVLDGSIVPSPLGANPSKTIAALAERGVSQLIETYA